MKFPLIIYTLAGAAAQAASNFKIHDSTTSSTLYADSIRPTHFSLLSVIREAQPFSTCSLLSPIDCLSGECYQLQDGFLPRIGPWLEYVARMPEMQHNVDKFPRSSDISNWEGQLCTQIELLKKAAVNIGKAIEKIATTLPFDYDGWLACTLACLDAEEAKLIIKTAIPKIIAITESYKKDIINLKNCLQSHHQESDLEVSRMTTYLLRFAEKKLHVLFGIEIFISKLIEASASQESVGKQTYIATLVQCHSPSFKAESRELLNALQKYIPSKKQLTLTYAGLSSRLAAVALVATLCLANAVFIKNRYKYIQRPRGRWKICTLYLDLDAEWKKNNAPRGIVSHDFPVTVKASKSKRNLMVQYFTSGSWNWIDARTNNRSWFGVPILQEMSIPLPPTCEINPKFQHVFAKVFFEPASGQKKIDSSQRPLKLIRITVGTVSWRPVKYTLMTDKNKAVLLKLKIDNHMRKLNVEFLPRWVWDGCDGYFAINLEEPPGIAVHPGGEVQILEEKYVDASQPLPIPNPSRIPKPTRFPKICAYTEDAHLYVAKLPKFMSQTTDRRTYIMKLSLAAKSQVTLDETYNFKVDYYPFSK